MSSSFDRSPQTHLRVAGMLYLAIILLGLFGEMMVRSRLVVVGDPAATARAIAASQPLWRAGIIGDLVMHILDIPVLLVFYQLLRPVDEGLALFATWANLIQTAVLAVNKLTLLVPLYLMAGPGYLSAFTADQLQTLSYLAIKAHGYGFEVGLIFFGVACLVRGYLMSRSGYVPKLLGLLTVFAGLGYLVNCFTLLIAPSFAAALSPGILLPAFIGECSCCLWMIVRGVTTARWHQGPGRDPSLRSRPDRPPLRRTSWR